MPWGQNQYGRRICEMDYGGRKSNKTFGIYFCYKKRSEHHHEQLKIATVQIVKKHKMKNFLSIRDSLPAAIFDLLWRETPKFKMLYLKDGASYCYCALVLRITRCVDHTGRARF